MKRTIRIVFAMGASLIALLAGSSLAQKPVTSSAKEEVALRDAIEKETVQGDIKGAIERYKKLAQSSDHAIAAKARIHLGESYDKLGSIEADKQYDLVIRKFADQADAVATARAHLSRNATTATGMAEHNVWELTSDFGRAVSPDGRYIAFSDSSGNLALHDLRTNTDRRLTHDGAGIDEVAFAPDGNQIAYIAFASTSRKSELRVLNLSATNPVPRIYTHADWEFDTVSWSHDGKWLASSAGPSGKSNQIVLVSAQDGSVRELKAEEPNSDHLDFSPDGKYLAYTRVNSARSGDVFVLPTEGGNEIPVVDWPSDEYATGWSPDGHLLFSSDRGGSRGLWALAFKDGKPYGQPSQITANIGGGVPVGLTSTGALYYQVTLGGTTSYVQKAPFDLAAGRILSPPVTIGQGTEPAWSSDGKYLAYVNVADSVLKISTGDGATRETRCPGHPSVIRWKPDNRTLGGIATFENTNTLCQIDAQSGAMTEVQLQKTRAGDILTGAPVWSPDQKKLYYRSISNPAKADGVTTFIEKDLASGTERIVIQRPSTSGLGGPNLSPDGQYIATHLDPSDSSAIVLIPVSGGEPKELLRRPGLGAVTFSPDGKYIAVVGGKSQSALVIPVAGGDLRELMNVTSPFSLGMAMWTPDSKSIFLKKSNQANEQAEMWRVPVEGGQAVRIDMNLNLDHIQGGISLNPKSNEIVFVRQETSRRIRQIWVLENFLSKISAVN
jgi:Tol biopolymer transport system component